MEFTPYLSAEEFLNYFDSRRVGQLCSDSDTELTPTELLSSPILLEMLQCASAELNSACQNAQRYNPTDLMNAVNDITTSTGFLIKRIVADLTFAYLVARRGLSQSDVNDMVPRLQWAESMLEQLRLGERVLDLDGSPAAGLPSVTKLGATIPIRFENSAQRRFWGNWSRSRNNLTGWREG